MACAGRQLHTLGSSEVYKAVITAPVSKLTTVLIWLTRHKTCAPNQRYQTIIVQMKRFPSPNVAYI